MSITSFNKFAKGKKVDDYEHEDCVIYTRVSTKEQAESNLSLETQLRECKALAARDKHTILAQFGGTYESAASDERKEFKRLIDFCKKHKKGRLKIIVYSLDRFSRTGDNAIWLSRQLRELGIQIISVTQPIDTKSPAGVLQQNILFLFSQYDNDVRRSKTIQGMLDHMEAGIWPCKAPTGYDNVTINGVKSIVLNDSGRLLRKAFLWKANEGLTMVEIIKRLESYGLKVTHNRLSVILSNPFYCGIISHSLLKGRVVPGNHEKVVSYAIFLKANEEKGKIPYGYKANLLNDSLPMKLFVKCASCQEYLRGYIVKSKKLFYYKCNNGGKCSCNVSAKHLHQKFKTILSELALDDSTTELFKLQLRKIYNTINESKKQRVDENKAKLKELHKKLMRLEERYINEELTTALYHKYCDKFKEEILNIEGELNSAVIPNSNLEKFIENAVNYASELPSLWDSSDYVGKHRLQKMIFPEGIYYNKKSDETRTPKINGLFRVIAGLKQVTEEKETGTSELIFKNSGLVAPKVENSNLILLDLMGIPKNEVSSHDKK